MTLLALDNMYIDEKGFPFVEEDDLIELMLENRSVKILPSNLKLWDQFDSACKQHKIENPFKLAETDLDWPMPPEYKNLDVLDLLLSRVKSPNEYKRVVEEYAEFESRDLIELLRFLIYMMSVIKDNNIVYGVGRGSSVSSYILYLIGVHRVNSLKFNLDIKEFLK
jgi:DNA polymerase III alpha subunit